MNLVDRDPPGAALVEEHISHSAGGSSRGAGKQTLGIKAKLFLALGVMAFLTVIGSSVAWYAFTNIEKSVQRITSESVPRMAASLRLAERSAEIAATAPALIASRKEEERVQQQQTIA